MNKKQHSAAILLMAVMAAPSMAHALDNGNDDKFKNGQPFKELAAEIAENTTTIETIEEGVYSLAYELDALALTVQTLQFAVSENTSGIALIESDIDAAKTQLDAILGASDQVAADLAALVAATGDNSVAIADLENQLADLAAQADVQVERMATGLAALKVDLDQEKSDLDGLAAYVEAVETGAQVSLGEMQANLDQLAIDVAAAETLVSQAQLNRESMDHLENLISANAEIAASREALQQLRFEYESHAHTFQDRSDVFRTTRERVYAYSYNHTHYHGYWRWSSYRCGWRSWCSYRYWYSYTYNHRHDVYNWVTTITAMAQYIESTTAIVE